MVRIDFKFGKLMEMQPDGTVKKTIQDYKSSFMIALLFMEP